MGAWGCGDTKYYFALAYFSISGIHACSGGAWKSSIFWACRITTCNARTYETRELLASLSGCCLMVRRPWAGQNHEGILMASHA